jgi:hypothetical protein
VYFGASFVETMPPKRKRPNQAPSPSAATAINNDNQKNDSVNSIDEAPPPKKIKTDSNTNEQPPPSLPQATDSLKKSENDTNNSNISKVVKDEETPNSDEEDDGRPVCWYDASCYRQNPLHFQQFRHPKKKALERKGLKVSPTVQSGKPQQTQTSTITNSKHHFTSLYY